MRNYHLAIALLVTIVAFAVLPVSAEGSTSNLFSSGAVEARLVVVQEGVPEDAETLSAALHVKLKPGWKTYWRSPGEVGSPPSIDWTGSLNVSDVAFFWPAPTRFRAFGIENFGYEKEVAFPLRIVLAEPGAPVALRARVSLLVCSTVCVPESFDLALTLGPGDKIDAEAADLLAAFTRRIPDNGQQSRMVFETAAFSKDKTTLTVTARAAEPFQTPDIFPEMGTEASFGAPDIRLGDSGRLIWAQFPVLSLPEEGTPLTVTLVDGERAATIPAKLSELPATAPYLISASPRGIAAIAGIVLAAFFGGLILNVMPCVLPVLSIKLNSVIKAGKQSQQRVRSGFLASAAGVLTFMWVLAGILIAAKTAGLSIGWGVQFQSPVFLALMIAILMIFTANLLGLFEITIPSEIQQKLVRGGDGGGYTGDFATGAFAAILATPCSAPFLGTAVAFALAGSPAMIMLIFTALGVGLALPYFLIAAVPSLVRVFPRPGSWMLAVKLVLGLILGGTVIWLIWVLVGVASALVASITVVADLLAIVLLSTGRRILPRAVRITLFAVIIAATVIVPLALTPQGSASGDVRSQDIAENAAIPWRRFERAAIGRLVSEGKTVFVDVTAAWCITCKANKALVLERGSVAAALNDPEVVAMVADWTRPDEDIARYLRSYGRYGIPFNIVYGPNAPDGIVLSEILTASDVMEVLSQAKKLPLKPR